MSDALNPAFTKPPIVSECGADARTAWIDAMFDRFARDMMIRFGLMLCGQTAVILAAIRYMPHR